MDWINLVVKRLGSIYTMAFNFIQLFWTIEDVKRSCRGPDQVSFIGQRKLGTKDNPTWRSGGSSFDIRSNDEDAIYHDISFLFLEF